MANNVGKALRAAIARRAGGRCEYCLIHDEDAGFSHQLDHIVSRKHGGDSTADNLALSCIACNRFKGADIASMSPSGSTVVRLFHPRLDRWADHFRFDADSIQALTDIGEATVRILRFNSKERVVERSLLRDLGRYPR